MPRIRHDRTDYTLDGWYTWKDWCRHHGVSRRAFQQKMLNGKIIKVVVPRYNADGTRLYQHRSVYLDREQVEYVLSHEVWKNPQASKKSNRL